MRRNQQGFTMIELIVVIVILGILAATALPKFIDLSGDASQAAVNGVGGALSSASATNYAARKVNSSYGTKVATCADVVNALQGGALPTTGGTYSILNGTTAVAADASVSCTVQLAKGSSTWTAPYTAIGIN